MPKLPVELEIARHATKVSAADHNKGYFIAITHGSLSVHMFPSSERYPEAIAGKHNVGSHDSRMQKGSSNRLHFE